MKKTHSTVETRKYSVNDLSSILDEVKNFTYVLLWKTDCVKLLKGEDVTSLEKLTELRAFNAESELHIIKSNGRFIGRLRTDSEDGSFGEPVEYIEDGYLLWGKPVSSDDKYTGLFEDRGISLNVPICVKDGERAFVTVRSYLKSDVFEICDLRLTNIFAREAETIE